MTAKKKYLRRYTDLPALIHVLRTKQVTLIDPETWDDTNDSHFLKLYREKKSLGSVLALCFSQNSETYHHWRVFADGASGVCITFKREPLVKAIGKQAGLLMGKVKYVKLNEISGVKPVIADLPFLKRYPYEPENEFRVIFESNAKLTSLDIPIPLACIDRVTLSPWLHLAFSRHVKETLRNIPGCSQLDIARSTLISNENWKAFGDSAINKNRVKKTP